MWTYTTIQLKQKENAQKKKKERKKKKKKRKERWEVPNSHFKTETPSLTVLHWIHLYLQSFSFQI